MNEFDTEPGTELNLADTNGRLNKHDDKPAFFPVSEGKRITMYILRFGLYGF